MATSTNGFGLRNASVYNPSGPSGDTWTPRPPPTGSPDPVPGSLPDMNAGRWYPTATVLKNGDVLVVSGSTGSGNNRVPEVFQFVSGTWSKRTLNSADLSLDLYPQMFLAPNGQVFNSGPSPTTRYLDTAGTGSWNPVPLSGRGGPTRDYGSAVMYAPGKILVMGGGGGNATGPPPEKSAQVIDLNQTSPSWSFVGPMQFARRQMNATLLPDGKVLATSGTSSPGFNDPAGAVYAAELWDPAKPMQWTTLASSLSIPRIYHSTAVLLPDGRVLIMGGNGDPQRNSEIYSPPYLFNVDGTPVTQLERPKILSAPTSVGYRQTFFVQTSDVATISKVTMLRLSSVTHAFNMSQYISTLSFSPAPQGGGLDVEAPSGAAVPSSSAPSVAPPGYYLLFILKPTSNDPADGVSGNDLVPSVGSIVQLGEAPTLTGSLSPPSAVAGGPAFTLTVNGSNFVSNSVVLWNGTTRTTTFVNGQLTAQILASDITTAGTASVTVQNPGGSNALTFTINPAPPLSPTLTDPLLPPSAVAGGPAFTLTVNGSNFVSGATVRWNATSRTTTFVNGTQLTAQIPASDITVANTALVTVLNSPGGAESNALTFTITQAGPPPLAIATSSLPNAKLGPPASYSATLTATGGTPPYKWSTIPIGAPSPLPPVLSLTEGGVISGTATSAASTAAPYRFTVQVSDSAPTARTATKAFTIKVNKR